MLLALCLVLGTAGCGDDGSSAPTTEEMRGIWHNEDSGTNRVFVFRMHDETNAELVGKTNVYMLYVYPVGDASVLVQTGTYVVDYRLVNDGNADVMTDALVTQVLWDDNGSLTGQEFGNPIDNWDGVSFTLGNTSGPGGNRDYVRVDAIP